MHWVKIPCPLHMHKNQRGLLTLRLSSSNLCRCFNHTFCVFITKSVLVTSFNTCRGREVERDDKNWIWSWFYAVYWIWAKKKIKNPNPLPDKSIQKNNLIFKTLTFNRIKYYFSFYPTYISGIIHHKDFMDSFEKNFPYIYLSIE